MKKLKTVECNIYCCVVFSPGDRRHRFVSAEGISLENRI